MTTFRLPAMWEGPLSIEYLVASAEQNGEHNDRMRAWQERVATRTHELSESVGELMDRAYHLTPEGKRAGRD